MDTPAPISALLRQPAFSRLAQVILTLPYGWSGIAKLADLDGALILSRMGWLTAGALGVFP